MTAASQPAGDAGRRVFLHIGAFKTGTTYLQGVLRTNHERLAEAGVLFPGGARWQQQVFAARDLMGTSPRGAAEPRIYGAWDSLVSTVHRWSGPSALVSMEFLSMAGVRQARRAVRSFEPAEVHVVLTARDLARVTPAMWQESLKASAQFSWSDYIAAVQDPTAAHRPPARGFWQGQDLVAILDTWETVVPPEQIHIVTVPPPGSPSTLLLGRFCEAVGVDAARLTLEAPWANESVGAPEAEVLRRLNVALDNRLNQRQYQRVAKSVVARHLADTTGSGRMALPEEYRAWAADQGRRMADVLGERGYPVVGDLEDLVPSPTASPAEGRGPDEATDSEVLDAAIRALTEVTERFAAQWWARKKPDPVPTDRGLRSRLGSRARNAEQLAKRVVVGLAQRHRVGARAVETYRRTSRRR